MTRIALALLAAMNCASCAVPPVQSAATFAPVPLTEGVEVAELDLGPLVSRVNAVDTSLRIQYGWLCLPTPPRTPSLDKLPFSTNDLARSFIAVLEPLGYKLKKSADSVFDADKAADYLVGGSITKLHSSVCFPFSGSANLNRGDPTLAKGSVFVEIKWEIYSTAERRVVFQAETQGRFEVKETIEGGFRTIALNAFMASLRNAAALDGFRKIALTPPQRLTPQKTQAVGERTWAMNRSNGPQQNTVAAKPAISDDANKYQIPRPSDFTH